MFKQQVTMEDIAHEFLILKNIFIIFFCQEDERMQ